MASLVTQKENLLTVLGTALAVFDGVVEKSSGKAGEELRGLYGGWIKEGLTEAKAEIGAIDIDKVRALRETKQTTEPVFESHIDSAARCLKDNKGVKYSINKLFEYKQQYSADEIRKLGRILKLADNALRRTTILRSPRLSLLTSGWLWVCLLAVALLAIPAYRYGSVYLHSASGAQSSPAREVVVKQIERDMDTVQVRAKEPNKSTLERSASVVKAVWDLMDTIPKIITALSAVWGIVLLWFRRR